MGPRPQRRAMIGRDEQIASRRSGAAPPATGRRCAGRSLPGPLPWRRPGLRATPRPALRRERKPGRDPPAPRRRSALGGVVGVEIAGGAGHVDALPAEQHADAAHQIDGADDRALLAVNLGERPKRGARPGPRARSAWPASCPRWRRAPLTGWCCEQTAGCAPSAIAEDRFPARWAGDPAIGLSGMSCGGWVRVCLRERGRFLLAR